ncbi:MAG: hypothetical protein ACRC62_30800, partial [Microcoleus sp.]
MVSRLLRRCKLESLSIPIKNSAIDYQQSIINPQLSTIDREWGRSHYNYQRSIASGDARTTTINDRSIASGDARTTTINDRSIASGDARTTTI